MGSSFRWASKRSKGMKGGVKVRHPGKPKKWIAGTAKAFLEGFPFYGGGWGIGEDDHDTMGANQRIHNNKKGTSAPPKKSA